MIRRLVIVTEIISPYRIPLFNELSKEQDVDLHVLFLSETDPSLRQWQVYKEEIRFSYEVLPSWRRRVGRFNVLLNTGMRDALQAKSPEAILCGGYNYLASWQALSWARKHNVPFLLWSESNAQDQRSGHVTVEFLKQVFLERCSGYVVPGKSAREYLLEKGIADDKIFIARNAVDNKLFAELAAEARQRAAFRRKELNLPDRYFLFVGRLVREKGVFELLLAYAKLEDSISSRVGLVFVGDGQSRGQLEAEARTIDVGRICFPGFAPRQVLASYYALAEALILPTYTDPWGLVVNEAMACGLPVILSHVAGCGPDLVREGWNGLLVPPREVSALKTAMETMLNNPDVMAEMGANSERLISEYSPEHWSRSIAAMLSRLELAHG